MRRTTSIESRRPVRAEVSPPARRAITPATLLLAMEQVVRSRPSLVSLLAKGDVEIKPP